LRAIAAPVRWAVKSRQRPGWAFVKQRPVSRKNLPRLRKPWRMATSAIVVVTGSLLLKVEWTKHKTRAKVLLQNIFAVPGIGIKVFSLKFPTQRIDLD
jgi:hypothetical protein